jgi:2-dehydro-3-deoxygluconokinase
MIELSLPEAGAPCVGIAGDTYNTAVYLKRSAPAIEVAYVTALGTDPLSERILAAFRAEGIASGLIERRPDRVPGLYAISTDAAGERSFTYWRNQSAARTLFDPAEVVTPGALEGFDLVYFSGITLAVLYPPARDLLAVALARVRARGGRVAFDGNYRQRLWSGPEEARAVMGRFWALADIGLPSADDEEALWGDADAVAVRDRLVLAGVRAGAVKRGAEGPLPIGWDGPLPEFPAAARVVDTTAAGDSFNGGYLAALLTGADAPTALRAGHDLAAKVIGYPGAIIPREA